MPIPLGVLAVAGAGAGPVAGGTYDLLETVLISGSGIQEIAFSNLNTNYGSTYQHLQIRAAARTAETGTYRPMTLRFNGDSGSNYARHFIDGNGTSVTSTAGTSTTAIFAGAMAGSFAAADVFGASVADILDPFETTKNTTVRALAGSHDVQRRIRLLSGFWNNTAAITSISLFSENFTFDFATGTRVSLYGLRSS